MCRTQAARIVELENLCTQQEARDAKVLRVRSGKRFGKERVEDVALPFLQASFKKLDRYVRRKGHRY